MERFVIIAVFLAGMVAFVGTGMDAPAPVAVPATGDHDAVAIVEAQATPPRAQSLSGKTITLDRHGDGHFYADVKINGTTVHMLVDTGASGVALTAADARRAGIATSIGMNDTVGEGAGGAVRGDIVTIKSISLGPTTVEGDTGVILKDGGMSLLGQSFLGKFDKVEIEDDRMILIAG